MLEQAFRALLEAAAEADAAGFPGPAPSDGGWNAEQILAHVSLVTATTLTTASAIASGTGAVYDNRVALDLWTIDRLIDRSGGGTGLTERLRAQGAALCALTTGAALTPAELDTQVPTLLLSDGKVLVDQLMPLRDLLTGLAEVELPTHTRQLLTLR
ncbi:hypothetical protein [Nonomuraea sp. NPDC050310]|uniref:hypothetical protein n=1 Tax=unclassified Nonomuraea TaxID=2593643 RepID=UPI0033E91037